MKKIYSIATMLLLLLSSSAFAQSGQFNNADVQSALDAKVIKEIDSTKAWKRGTTITANYTTSSFTNWASGGQNATTLLTQFVTYANYTKNRHSWRNYLELGYGISKINGSTKKADDRIILTTRYSFEIKKPWYITALADFRTQFADGYKYSINDSTKREDKTLISRFMAPAYGVASVGLEYRPGEVFFAVLSPATIKNTYVLDQALANVGAFGVDKGSNIRTEIGAYLNTGLHIKVMQNIDFISKANFFMNYKTVDKIDIFWDNILVFKVNKYINATFNYTIIYDDDISIPQSDGTVIGPRIQEKAVLGVGLSASF